MVWTELLMVARAVHTCEVEEADAWTWGLTLSSTPRKSISQKLGQRCCVNHGYLGLLPVRLLLPFSTLMADVSIIVAIETLRVPLDIAIRKVATSFQVHILHVNVHGSTPWYWARRSVNGGGGRRVWESNNVQASMRLAMRMASLNVLSREATSDVMAQTVS